MGYENRNVLSSNRIVVQLDGKNVGLVQSVEMRDDYAPEAASGIGDIHVKEYVPTMAHHSLNVEEMVLNKNSMQKAGVAFENGDAALNGIVFDFVSVNKETGEVSRKYIGCSYASGSLSIRKHSIVMASGSFNALDVTNGA